MQSGKSVLKHFDKYSLLVSGDEPVGNINSNNVYLWWGNDHIIHSL